MDLVSQVKEKERIAALAKLNELNKLIGVPPFIEGYVYNIDAFNFVGQTRAANDRVFSGNTSGPLPSSVYTPPAPQSAPESQSAPQQSLPSQNESKTAQSKKPSDTQNIIIALVIAIVVAAAIYFLTKKI